MPATMPDYENQKKRHNRVGAWIKALRMAQIVRVAAWLPSTIRQWVAAKF